MVVNHTLPVSVGILTLNSAKDLPRTLQSVAAFEDVYICDGNSTDGTQDIARQYGARIVRQVETDKPNQKITDFGATRTKCVNAAKYKWYFRLDSDEYLSTEAVEEIRAIVANPNPPCRVYKIPRKYVWRGKIIDDTITYPNRQIRFFHRDTVEGYTKITHERVVVKSGEKIGILKNPMFVPLHDTYDDFNKKRLARALDWDRRHYEALLTFPKWLYAIFHTIAQLFLFSLRFIRVRFISSGNKLPLSYELWRFKYLVATMWLATWIIFQKMAGSHSGK